MATYNGHNEDSSGNILLNIGNGMTATVELGSTASQAYTKGAYLFFNNRLCKASSAISSGATLAIGTNLSQTSLGAELTSHLRASNGDEFYFDYKDGKAGYYPSASKTASQFVPFGGTMSTIGSYTLYSCGGLYALPNSTFTISATIGDIFLAYGGSGRVQSASDPLYTFTNATVLDSKYSQSVYTPRSDILGCFYLVKATGTTITVKVNSNSSSIVYDAFIIKLS